MIVPSNTIQSVESGPMQKSHPEGHISHSFVNALP